MDDVPFVVGTATYQNLTIVHPLGVFTVIVAGLSVLFLQRRWAPLPVIAIACFVSLAQRIVIAGLDFDFLRIVILFGIARIALRSEYRGFVWKPIDKAVLLCTISLSFFHVVHYATFSAVVNRLGVSLNILGTYFLFRCWIRTWTDLDRVILGCILISIPEAVFFVIENQTGRNWFSIFGGVNEFTEIRQGRLRCQGPFTHPILAGCFWSSIIPLAASRWWKPAFGAKIMALIGVITSVTVVICSASSTPVLGSLAAIIGAGFFFLRRYMRAVRWALLFTLIGLHIVMQGPVWHLIARVSAVGGSTGWHRYNLINQTIINFRQWWFSGVSVHVIESWGVWAGDVTNHYIAIAVDGGVVTLILFIAILTFAFGAVGKTWRSQARKPYRLALSWALGVSLFVHCTNFIGITYFGQTFVILYLVLAMIGSMSVAATRASKRTASVLAKQPAPSFST